MTLDQRDLLSALLDDRPWLEPLAAKVAQVHGDHDPRLREVHQVFLSLLDESAEPGAALRRIRELADGFTPPDWACTSYRRLLSELQTLDGELRGSIART